MQLSIHWAYSLPLHLWLFSQCQAIKCIHNVRAISRQLTLFILLYCRWKIYNAVAQITRTICFIESITCVCLANLTRFISLKQNVTLTQFHSLSPILSISFYSNSVFFSVLLKNSIFYSFSLIALSDISFQFDLKALSMESGSIDSTRNALPSRWKLAICWNGF